MQNFKIKKNFYILILLIVLCSNLIFADGFIIAPRPMPPDRDRHVPQTTSPVFPLSVKKHMVNVSISENAAVTNIDQTFYNPSGVRLEGDYIFPVPKNAVIKKFSMFIDGKEQEAEFLDSVKARKIYEDIVRKQKDPALLEYSDRNIFRVRIFPIEPKSDKRIKISYTEILNEDNGIFEYLYPLNTEKFSSEPINEVSVSVDITSKIPIKNIYSPDFDILVKRKGDDKYSVFYQSKNSKPDRDFKLYFTREKSNLGFSMLSYKNAEEEEGYFFLTVCPGYDSSKFEKEILVKDITFCIDISGSMNGEKLEQAKKAILFCINNLNLGDKFQIVKFSTEAETLFEELEEYSELNIKKAKKFVNNFKAIGGTNIDEALNLALKSRKNYTGTRPYFIALITDGKPTVGETDENKLLKKIKDSNVENTRIFTVGVGNDLNTHLLDKLTEMTNAYRTYISPEEDIEIKISNFYTNIQSPIMTDIDIKFSGDIKTSKLYPVKLPDLFISSPLTIFGKYSGSGNSEIQIAGNINGKKQKFLLNGKFSADNEKYDFIPQLWAARRIGYLLDYIRLRGENLELKDEITALARKFGIITPYTSMLILEDEVSLSTNGRIDTRDMTIGNMIKKNDALRTVQKHEAEESKKGISDKSGLTSIVASKEAQSLYFSANAPAYKSASKKIIYSNSSGENTDIQTQVRNVQGRAFYNADGFWIDSKTKSKSEAKNIRIQFASDKYFELLKSDKNLPEILSMGKNLRFNYKNINYEIYE